jgi:hypothetical protein
MGFNSCLCTLCTCRCATLPSQTKYGTHILTLVYEIEDNFVENYCQICKEEIEPDHWVYDCDEWDLAAHPQCVLGNDSYIKFGETYKDEDHEHPLVIVQKTKHSSPCDACGKPFDGAALECTQCKFNVHLRTKVLGLKDCLLQVNKKVK